MELGEYETKYESYDEFYSDLTNPHGLRTRIGGIDLYIYRGEPTSTYQLLPNVLRSENYRKLINYSSGFIRSGFDIDSSTNGFWIILKEYIALSKFYSYANSQGLKLPNITHMQKQTKQSVIGSEYFRRNGEKFIWYDDELADLASLAQHYGCLTRMLDWTYDLFVALYFASHGAIKTALLGNDKNDDYMVIWLLNIQHLGLKRHIDNNFPLSTIVPPYSDNPNLCAQKGILTYWRSVCMKDSDSFKQIKIDRTPLDQLILREEPALKIGIPFIYRLKIPVKENIATFRDINWLGYDSARMFPGYGGVIMKMEDDVMLARLEDMRSEQNKL